jgi:hypothetical protein
VNLVANELRLAGDPAARTALVVAWEPYRLAHEEALVEDDCVEPVTPSNRSCF